MSRSEWCGTHSEGTNTLQASGGGRGLKRIRQQKEKHAELAARTSARMELLLNEDAGCVEAEGAERTFRYRQSEMAAAVPVAAAQNYFDLQLEQLGPYSLSYSRNGRNLLIGGAKGHIATMDWREKRLVTEFNVREAVRDVQFLHNEMLFAVAQKRSVYIYDHTGMELHCLKRHSHVNRLTFLPYHFLLVTADDHGTLRYLDTSTGQSVAEIRTRLGALKCVAQNPRNAVVQLGHFNGSVSLWSPSVSSPLAKIQCHRGPLTSLAVDTPGHYLLTAAMDSTVKVWDMRTYQPLHTYKMPRPAISMDISGRGLLAVGRGRQVSIWRDVFSQKQLSPYLTHGVKGEICSLQFCPFEDCLGIGHALGFSSMLTPGSGEPNFDALEANPFQTKRQRQEAEVKQLLEKIPPELIQIESDSIARLRKTSGVEEEEVGEEGGSRERRGTRVGGKTLALKRQKSREHFARAKRRTAVHKELENQKRSQTGDKSDCSDEAGAQKNIILARFRK
ncbi:Probable U3 small nucleolar RNA-associated protein 7 [Geodia barretti]|uniref:Probable U3 small nucleolar RNA-associated protein 7 n=1 Tax=Geodia barretti TaxID=519541 RepID=A0AA35SBI0_GEOBA|nr:Probable U3 small nucleolar RNA-associated protein 7 [Geodia barretti]